MCCLNMVKWWRAAWESRQTKHLALSSTSCLVYWVGTVEVMRTCEPQHTQLLRHCGFTLHWIIKYNFHCLPLFCSKMLMFRGFVSRKSIQLALTTLLQNIFSWHFIKGSYQITPFTHNASVGTAFHTWVGRCSQNMESLSMNLLPLKANGWASVCSRVWLSHQRMGMKAWL